MNPDELGDQLDSQINLKLSKALKKRLEKFESVSGISVAAMLRQLATAVVDYHAETGRFTLPAVVMPVSDYELFGKTEITAKETGEAVKSRLADLQNANILRAQSGVVSPARKAAKDERELQYDVEQMDSDSIKGARQVSKNQKAQHRSPKSK